MDMPTDQDVEQAFAMALALKAVDENADLWNAYHPEVSVGRGVVYRQSDGVVVRSAC